MFAKIQFNYLKTKLTYTEILQHINYNYYIIHCTYSCIYPLSYRFVFYSQ